MTAALRIIDSRTEAEYEVPVYDNYVLAKDLSCIESADGGASKKLRILDNGYEHTACMKSAITHIDGHRGEIRYRDVPVEELFRNNDFEEVLHLLVWGQFPSKEKKMTIRGTINEALIPPSNVVNTISSFPRDSEMQPMITAGLSAFIAADKTAAKSRSQHKAIYREDLQIADNALLRTIGFYAATIALAYCHKRGTHFNQPDPSRSMLGNLLFMMGKVDAEDNSKPDAKLETTLNKLWILYADHEMTNSTAAILHAASTLTDPTSALMAGVISGYGPLHGGAIELAYSALEKIGQPSNVPAYIEMVKKSKARLMGYGHRIYKTRDPRLALIEDLIAQNKDIVSNSLLLQTALKIDEVANKDEYFVSRNLKANADLLGCFFYSALGFDRDVIIAITTLSRVPGTMAHWRESLTQPIKLWRPQQIYSNGVEE